MAGTKNYGTQCRLTEGCKRKPRYADGGCEPCHFRGLNEGTVKRLENHQRTKAYGERKKLVDAYNKLILEGLKPHEIAQLWNIDRKKLAIKIYRAKRFSKLKVVDGAAIRWQEGKPNVKPTAKIRLKVAGHGEGKRGKKGCNEECCMKIRRQTWKENNVRYRKRLAERKAAAQKAAQGQGLDDV